ncbi:YncE family protein [Brevibacterium moorei]|uniref:YncE family protein n=1 Tax=Brevibacterium moorei TaxID=2968457 RepID=UPI00211BF8F4|nr:hypothetical protein [Brevibacterium sp. 68QC2CO]MCQ9385850.1 hypothetical protein [Brevibacterium sp. 68QC2CO]
MKFNPIPTKAGKRLGALSLAVAVGAGVPLATAPIDFLSAPAAAAEAKQPRPDSGQGKLSIDGETAVEAGGKITLKGTGFAANDELSVKIDDGAYKQDGDDVIYAVDSDDKGEFTKELALPSDLEAGDHWFRVLSPNSSQHVTFSVKEADAPAAEPTIDVPTTVAEGGKLKVTGKSWLNEKPNANGQMAPTIAFKLDGGQVWRTGDIDVDGEKIEVYKDADGNVLDAPEDGTAGPGDLKRGSVWAAIKADEKTGDWSIEIPMPTADNSTSEDQQEDAEEAPVSDKWKEGSKHTLQVLSGSIVEGDVSKPSRHTFNVTKAEDPSEETPVAEDVTDEVKKAQTAVADVPGTTAKDSKIAGKETSFAQGLYQTAFSKKNNAVYATTAVGRPPVKESKLVKLDADSLKVQKAVNAPIDAKATDKEGNPQEGARYAMYGVDVDEANNTVWVTNTRQNTVAVYDADTLELVKQFPKDSAAHGRDVQVDEKAGKAYVTIGTDGIAVFDTKTLKQLDTIKVEDNFYTMSIAFDAASQTAYIPSMNSARVAKLNTANGKLDYMDIPATVESASGIAFDPQSKTLAIASQASADTSVVFMNAENGELIKSVKLTAQDADGKDVAAGSLNAAFDTTKKLFYVSNRAAGTVTVYDNQGNDVQTLDALKNANHVMADGAGHVFGVSKGGNRDGESKDLLQRFEAAPIDYDNLTAEDATDEVKQSPVVDVPGTTDESSKIIGKETAVSRGFYQTAFSKKNNAIYATTAVGRPPVKESKLIKLDADSLQVQKAVNAPADPSERGDRAGARFAVYGVDVDETNNTVWVTNTRQNSVAVYDADSLKLIKQFESGSAAHGRDVQVDEKAGKAYVTIGTDGIAVFDTKTLKQLDTIKVEDNFYTMSIAFDQASQTAYIPSMNSARYAVLDTATGKVAYKDIPAKVETASGIAFDPKSKTLAIASQASADTSVVFVDAESGKLIKSVKLTAKDADGNEVAAGSLNAAFDAKSGWFYVSNRTAGTVTVYDVKGNEVQTLDALKNANHVMSDGEGHIFGVSKGGPREGTPAPGAQAEGDEPDARDLLQRFEAKADDSQPDPDPSDEPTDEPTDGSGDDNDSGDNGGSDDANGSGDNGGSDDANGSGDNGGSDDANGSGDNGGSDNEAGDDNDGKLPVTGAQIGAAIAAGAALLIVGGAAVTISRRRHKEI